MPSLWKVVSDATTGHGVPDMRAALYWRGRPERLETKRGVRSRTAVRDMETRPATVRSPLGRLLRSRLAMSIRTIN